MSARSIIQRHYDAGAKGDVPGMFADFAPNAEWIERTLPAPGVFIGADAVLQNVFAAIGATYEDFRFTLDQLVGDDDVIVALGWYEGRVRSTGSVIKVRASHIWTVRNGAIIRFEQIADTACVEMALSRDNS
jgi:ketosteroid isomerase-like protein